MKITPKLRDRISAEWKELLPSFGQIRPLWFGRRVGPFVQGILLERKSGNECYEPLTHVHCLCFGRDSIALNMLQQLRFKRGNGLVKIKAEAHEKYYRDACADLLKASYLPTQGPWAMKEVVDAYATFFRDNPWEIPMRRMLDVVSACCWLGDMTEAQKLIGHYVDSVRNVSEGYFRDWGGRSGWIAKLKKMLTTQSELQGIVEKEINVLKIEGLPVSELVA